jgi:hypothetical protein
MFDYRVHVEKTGTIKLYTIYNSCFEHKFTQKKISHG